ncbi:U3 small nucleolar RNA-associated protein 6-domain-containing protein [Parasitella parasitica]|nr:U3 small nucleolar RNA-associated protein 6-domain-containing protein [Parasitella parasitica]
MAESVQYYLERMIPELEELEKKNIFSAVEIKSIIKKRTNFEYALQRRIKQKIDFLRAIEYEINLEDLRKKRVARMGIAESLKGNDLQYSGARRIYNLFRRATIKFKSDLSLWLQYIDYAKRSNANNILSSVFVLAIQYHPNNASLWIMAATWENEHNANIAAARILLQRALRLIPESQELWHEYFRLELLYVEKIKLRRRILGIDQAKNQENLDAMQVDQEEQDDNTIKLPAVTGEDVSRWKEDEENIKKSKKSLTKEEAAALEEANNPILQGLLARIIYDNAILSQADSIEFRSKFIDIYREFTDTQKDIDYVYETIRRDMADSAEARALLAKSHLLVSIPQQEEKSRHISVSDPAFVPALKQCVDEFENALVDVPQFDMWKLYIQFLLGWYAVVIEENLKLYLGKLLQKTFKACKRQSKLDAKIYELWVAHLMEQNEQEKAESVALQALESHPTDALLWIYRIQLAQDDRKEQRKLYATALDHNPDSLSLWNSYKNWVLSSDKLSAEETDKVLFQACEKATLLLPSVTSDSADRNDIKQLLQSTYVQWAAESQGIEAARRVYKKVVKNFYPTHAFFMKCIQLENEFGNPDATSQESVEYLYDKITLLEDDKEGSYISYLAYLYSQKKFQKANQVYNRASKEVPNKESLDLKVQKLKASSQTTL